MSGLLTEMARLSFERCEAARARESEAQLWSRANAMPAAPKTYRADAAFIAGRPPDRALDAWIFNGNDTPVRDVMVGGRLLVREREHIRERPIRQAFFRTTARAADALP